VTRWEPDAGDRLQRAALELFTEQGFAQTTVPQIAERAGLTTRSFFRHYADKREVLFKGDDEIPEAVGALMASRPPGLSLMELIIWGVETMARNVLGQQRDYLTVRRAIIATDDGLQERELRKLTALATAIARALQDQGLDALTATLAGKTATTISSTAIEQWLNATDQRPLVDFVAQARQAFTSLVTDQTPWRDRLQ
jgi:AcrR family transcriptional regulator